MEQQKFTTYSIFFIWMINCLLGVFIAVKEIWIPYMSASNDSYLHIKSDAFNGTTMPIAYIPNYKNSLNGDKMKLFDQYAISDFTTIPQYNSDLLQNPNTEKENVFLQKYVYITPYMGSYRMNYLENDGSHPAVDIRAPIGTPVLSIANWVVVRTINGDSTGAKHVVIRHDNVPYNGKIITIYSSYTHLSEILAQEGTKVRKGDLIGRVGMSWIATTPHLHLQIDTNDAPYHPYWPYNSQDMKQAWVSWFDAINVGLGKENAKKYTIHPMDFIQNQWKTTMVASASSQKTTTKTTATKTTTKTTNVSTSTPVKTVVASEITYNDTNAACPNIRFTDVPEKSGLGKILYPLAQKYCIFDDDSLFQPKEIINRRDMLMLLMNFLELNPRSNEQSSMLDVSVNDPVQGYILKAEQMGVIDGIYFYPNKRVTRWEFIDMLMRLARKTGNNQWNLEIYTDIPSNSLYTKSLQEYAIFIWAKRGRIYPTNDITYQEIVKILSTFEEHR